MAPAPPPPSHVLRIHTAQITALAFSDDNERVYSGDSSGRVAVSSTRTFRPTAVWAAHTDGLLGIQEWAASDAIITHGRDNKLHIWRRVAGPLLAVGDSAASSAQGVQPQLLYSMDVNALNYCRFSLLDVDGRALIAVPNLVDSSLADVWQLPSQNRLHAAVGKEGMPRTDDGRGEGKTGIIMSMHLFHVPSETAPTGQLRLLAAYENGSVVLWADVGPPGRKSIEGIGWAKVWTSKLHVESIMAMTITRDCRIAFTVSADHLVGRYDLAAAEKSVEDGCKTYRTKYPGNAAVAVRDDGRVCAIAGWDGKVRLYSARTLKPLGTLAYHKDGCQAVQFAHNIPPGASASVDEESDDEMDEHDKQERAQWLVSGGKDSRVVIWPLISFDKT